MRKRRLFWQVFPAYVLLTVGLLLLLLLESRGRLRDFYVDQTAADLAASAALFAEAAKAPLENSQYGEVDALAKPLGKAS
jgi:two-component system, OmpR family, phosphate regulon sensor histidine kinase PhoR